MDTEEPSSSTFQSHQKKKAVGSLFPLSQVYPISLAANYFVCHMHSRVSLNVCCFIQYTSHSTNFLDHFLFGSFPFDDYLNLERLTELTKLNMLIFLVKISATMACLTLSASGWVNNIILYLITEFNFKIIDAARGFNVISGCMALFPILGAVIADSFIGCFSVIWISSIINLLVIMLNPLFTFHHETSRR